MLSVSFTSYLVVPHPTWHHWNSLLEMTILDNWYTTNASLLIERKFKGTYPFWVFILHRDLLTTKRWAPNCLIISGYSLVSGNHSYITDTLTNFLNSNVHVSLLLRLKLILPDKNVWYIVREMWKTRLNNLNIAFFSDDSQNSFQRKYDERFC